MKHAPKLLLVAAAPLLWASTSPGTRIAFAPEEGTTVTRTYTETTELTLEEMSISMNGTEIDPSMLGDMQMNSSATVTKTITDQFVRVGDGRALELRRTFDSLENEASMSQTSMMGDQDMDLSGESELEGKTVVFSLDSESGEMNVDFSEDDADAESELLEDLLEDMDMRALLPTEEVAEGDSWELDVSTLVSVFAPGGDVKLVPDMTDAGDMGGGPSPSNDMSQILGDMEGTATATFEGTRDEEGTNVAVIVFEFDISSAKDMTEAVAEMMESQSPEGMEEIEIDVSSVDIEVQYAGRGQLLWNLTSGRAHSFEFTGDMTMITDMAMSVTGTPMGDMEQELSIEMSGSTTIQGTIE